MSNSDPSAKAVASSASTDSKPAAKTDKPAAKAKPEKKPSGVGGFLLGLLVLILIGAVAGGGYFGWQYWQQDQLAKQNLSQALNTQNQQLQQLQQSQQQATQTLASTGAADLELTEAITAVQQRLDSHNKRLISLSSTSREDWLLAEAEYLLRLANQRLLTERATRGALGLLQTADAILKDMDDVDLFPIRKAIGQDIAALKLSPKVDRDGLFLRMAGLASQIDKLPTLPKRTPMIERKREIETPVLVENSTYMDTLKGWGASTVDYMKGFIIIRRNQPVQALLPPEAQAYIKLNLRFMLERAELAMLREEEVIYKTSLQQAREWLQTQFPPNNQIEAFIEELHDLEAQEVVAPLPDITSSLEQLRVYIERLHQVKSSMPVPATPKTDEAQSGNSAAAKEA